MFDLPYGMPVDDEIDVSDGAILPFENGSVTTYLGRRSTASGHRIVRAGRVVAVSYTHLTLPTTPYV